MNQEKIPHYVDPSTIKSKFANAIARMTDYAWWLMKHRNYVVDLGFVYKDGALGGGSLLVKKSIDEVVSDCKAYVEMNAKSGNLRAVYVNGGNGNDRPGILAYRVGI